ncbi:methylmalonyl Co-A mutase-associated GTPase MeaB [Cellulophaga sp. F20128]|uniref:methylmalonyl Co-A mutase-associated GTPase MeaB n=1 Tax=Cellulophaga sp. F20128 TaxID=2926413 RepID=UPI001FF1F7D3|nr:methylmalonyl Co-A mutase-associated GTPase MeaB [Cellulophaga sp. F20128]MCK0158717.1 methylmalonyl Co-A mutase-associated GTPase MeaB [Cellulophaga sp. F20128]
MSTPKNISIESASKIKNFRRNTPSTDTLIAAILNGDKTALSRAITLVESTKTDHAKQAKSILEKCLTTASKSIRIGITGVPGVGKSTFIERFGKRLTAQGKKVAVLAVDPTSTVTRGSILGDKTRMEELVKDSNAFIRPSPSGTSLGGVARKTRETIILCEAAGYDVILIETVGVGQSETAVHSMVDFFLLLKLAGAGDELQGIKRGIMEMADAIVINKSDGANKQAAKLARIEFSRALHLLKSKDNNWTPKVLACSALEDIGIQEIWDTIEEFFHLQSKNGSFHTKRQEQNKHWLLQTIEDQLKQDFYQDHAVKAQLDFFITAVIANKISPFSAAEQLLKLHNGTKT